MKRPGPLILFLILVLGSGLALGFLTAPGDWYAGLAKPAFNPPAWLFAPIWTVLFVFIAVAGWRTLQKLWGSNAAPEHCAQADLNMI